MMGLKKEVTEREKIIEFPVFNYTVHLVITWDVTQSRMNRSDALGPLEPGLCSALHSYKEDESVSYLFLPVNAKPGVVVHEAWHCIWRIWDWIGADFENEVVAYHIEYLVDKIHEFLAEKL